VAVRAAGRRVDDPLPGRRLHEFAQHNEKPRTNSGFGVAGTFRRGEVRT
jgi:hypothetical protein